ncbi:hypothetical protein [Methermicoccus shengliensis]|uniref:Uncharacterized protein n=1 Tax=Methermicoccus shengliensis TaxID=660064 RepID=A0A832RX00_9EURY|nr:MAG: hypothetical protein XD46_1220 [Euryarchaeota archaeon 55_53]KUK29528.1 MAG: hypothetical protein XD62_1386 [Methanosarcinales archeaon 56_1174]HIH69924.1 hypothetical protein [Methermicoccus shengliensis]
MSEKKGDKRGDRQPSNGNEMSSMTVECVIQKHAEAIAPLLRDFLKTYEETVKVLETAIECIETSKSSGGGEVGYALISIVVAHKALFDLNNELENLLTAIKKRRKNMIEHIKIASESQCANVMIEKIVNALDIDEKHWDFN